MAGVLLSCGGGSGGGNSDGGGGDGGGAGNSVQVMFTTTGAIVGNWSYESSLNLLCRANELDMSVKNATTTDAGDTHSSITISGNGSFTYRSNTVPGGVKGMASGGATVASDYKKVDWKVTFSNTSASDMKGNNVTLNGSITATCIL